jgi:hypothetical protein
MKLKEIEVLKGRTFSNSYGKSSYISEYCYYEGTEQISIYIKTGYGASETTTHKVISEHDLQEWINNFKNEKEEIIVSNITEIKENIMSENLESKEDEKIDNFNSMREIIFESIKMVKDGSLDLDKAKTISMLSQTIINSVKVEVDFLKLTGSTDKPKMIQ